MALCKNEDIKLLIKMEKLIGFNEKLLFGENKDKVLKVENYKISFDDFISYMNLVENFIQNKSSNNTRQKQWNKDNKDYHRIMNNICGARKRNDKEKLEKWTRELELLKQNKKNSL